MTDREYSCVDPVGNVHAGQVPLPHLGSDVAGAHPGAGAEVEHAFPRVEVQIADEAAVVGREQGAPQCQG